MPSKESLERRLQVGDEVLVPAQIVQYVEPRSCGVQIKLGAGGRATHLVWVNESELLLKADLLDEAIREARRETKIATIVSAIYVVATYSDSITSPFCEEKVAVADSMIEAARVIEKELRERLAQLREGKP